MAAYVAAVIRADNKWRTEAEQKRKEEKETKKEILTGKLKSSDLTWRRKRNLHQIESSDQAGEEKKKNYEI